MKKIILSLVAIASAGSIAFAQNYDEIKNLLFLRQYKKAKESLDKNWTNTKFTAKPEAHILKSNVLAGLSADSGVSNTDANALRSESKTVLYKYKEMDPKMTLVTEQGSIYSNGPITLYGGY